MNSQKVKELINKHPQQFYVYVLKKPDGTPFYVGKASWGNRFRIFCHEADVRNSYNHHYYKDNLIKRIWDKGGQVDYEIVLFTESEKEAFEKEIELVELYGRKSNHTGILANLANGRERGGNGGANKGQKRSLEEILKMSISHKGKPSSVKGYKFTKEQREKLSKAHRGHKLPEDQKKKIAESNRRTKGTEEYREKVSSLTKGEKNPMYGRKGIDSSMYGRYGEKHPWYGKNHSDETKKKISEASKRMWTVKSREVTAQTREKISKAGLGRKVSAETRKKISETLKRRFNGSKPIC